MFSIQNVFFSSDLSNCTGQPQSFSSNRKKNTNKETKQRNICWIDVSLPSNIRKGKQQKENYLTRENAQAGRQE